ncbi:3'-5' exonuclease [Castellaniella sp.]|uniref:3'-5' exonuclease n=1 Tax=Castellaniella sp. TaxID=1955812 RepID=UPI002B002F2A|nr:3'-5' exonuclease [Castellaniella sp.]
MTLFVGIDLETTGLDWATGHRIIEVAAIIYREDETRVGAYVQRIDPERAIDPKAQAVHGISYEELSMCPKWEAVAPKLHALLSKCDEAVAHNGRGFDAPFLIHEFDRVGLSVPSCLHRCVDTMVDGRWATPMGKLPNLGEFAFATGTPYDVAQAHGAEYDVMVMMQAFFAARKWGYFNAINTARSAA